MTRCRHCDDRRPREGIVHRWQIGQRVYMALCLAHLNLRAHLRKR